MLEGYNPSVGYTRLLTFICVLNLFILHSLFIFTLIVVILHHLYTCVFLHELSCVPSEC